LYASPFLRDGEFARGFGKAFVVTKQKTFAAILHLGPVGECPENDGNFQWSGPLGFGGGQLSAFWTENTGSVILGRRSGMHWDRCYDDTAKWRLWPLHAVSGATVEGKMFTSARIIRPDTTFAIKGTEATARAAGVVPASMLGQTDVLKGRIEYAREFAAGPAGVQVTTTVKGDGEDLLTELVETIPVYLREQRKQKSAKPTLIEFRLAGTWQPATAEWQDKVEAVRLTRFTGTVEIEFETPQRTRLATEDWVDSYLSRASCRNLLIDLLRDTGQPAQLNGTRTVSYRIAAATE